VRNAGSARASRLIRPPLIASDPKSTATRARCKVRGKRRARQNSAANGRHGTGRWGGHDRRDPPCAGPTTNSANLLPSGRPTRRSKLPSGCTASARRYAGRQCGCAGRDCCRPIFLSISTSIRQSGRGPGRNQGSWQSCHRRHPSTTRQFGQLSFSRTVLSSSLCRFPSNTVTPCCLPTAPAMSTPSQRLSQRCWRQTRKRPRSISRPRSAPPPGKRTWWPTAPQPVSRLCKWGLRVGCKAGSGRGPWYLARSRALSTGLSNAYFKSLGLPSLFQSC
jgi:hypothetical protein